ncbi:MAG: CDP-alcohol phosphatidyltransferase family protein, partial [Actinomycetota bacterium]|nr:CDP-alcohol phosphatidyltransferase family protein [Actinomycetota bacterium]
MEGSSAAGAVRGRRRPTIAEVRAVGQPPSILGRSMHEHWSGLLYGRTISPYLTRALLPTRVTPDAVTAAMWLSGVAAAAVLTIPSPAAALAAFALIQLQLVLDCADGELARWRQKTGSVRGVYIDAMGHVTTNA